MLNIVVDTSVVIAAMIGRSGPSREVLRRCLLGQYTPLIGNTLFAEYEDVIARDNILQQCPISKHEIRTLLNAFYARCDWVSVYYLWRPNLRDEADNHLVELAVAGNAYFLVTNNMRDFQQAQLHFAQLQIIKPQDLLRGH